MKLRMWYSVFGAKDTCPDPVSFPLALRPAEKGLVVEFDSHDIWEKATIHLTDVGRVLLFRYDGTSEEFRSRMDTLLSGGWPAYVSEEDSAPVLTHLRRTVQMINFYPVASSRDAKMARICEQICGHISRVTDGLIQVFQEGFFNPQGESICPRCDKHRLKTS